MKNFEDFLREKHADEYDLGMEGDFDVWVLELHADNLIEFAEEWHKLETKENITIKVKSWINEDELTSENMYNALFPLSVVNITRMFPREIERANQ